MLCSAKVNSNAESSVGLMTLAGRSATILVTSTRDPGRIFTCLHDVNFDGLADFVAGIQKAQLALKHRQNTLQRQRIVVFISSPILVEVEALVKLGKNLKKNNVSVDVVNIGLEGENMTKIDAFIGAVNSNDTSRVLHVGPGQNLADSLMQSDIYIERDGAAATSGDAGFGVDPAVDPELAMALRMSMEEERARQAAAREAEAKASTSVAGEEGKAEDKPSASGEASASGAAAAANYDDNDDDLYGTGTGGERMEVDGDDEDAEMLRMAIALSKAEEEQSAKKEEEKKE